MRLPKVYKLYIMYSVLIDLHNIIRICSLLILFFTCLETAVTKGWIMATCRGSELVARLKTLRFCYEELPSLRNVTVFRFQYCDNILNVDDQHLQHILRTSYAVFSIKQAMTRCQKQHWIRTNSTHVNLIVTPICHHLRCWNCVRCNRIKHSRGPLADATRRDVVRRSFDLVFIDFACYSTYPYYVEIVTLPTWLSSRTFTVFEGCFILSSSSLKKNFFFINY